jgi:hypothetical protein
LTVALILIAALASAGAPRDIAFDDTREPAGPRYFGAHGFLCQDGRAKAQPAVSSVTSNRLWRIAIDRSGHVGAITQLTPSQPLNGADGFRLIRGNVFLLAENAAGRLDEVHISGDRAMITVIKEGLDTPTSAIALGRTIYGAERKIEFVNTPALKGKDPGPFKIFAMSLRPSNSTDMDVMISSH